MKLPKRITVAARQLPNTFEAVKQEDGSYKFSGFDGRFMEIILEKFGVPFDIIAPEDDIYGEEGPGGNWTGVLGLLQRRQADIACGVLAPTYERLKFFDFSDGYCLGYVTFGMKRPQNLPVANAFLYVCLGYVTFGMKRPQNLPVANAFLYAFTEALWLSLVFVLPLFAFIYYFLLGRQYSGLRLCLEMVSSLIKQPMDIRMESLKERFLLGSWLVFALITSFAYTQVLLSQAAVPPEGKLYKDFEELLEAVKMKKLNVYLVDGSVFQDLFENSPQQHVRELGKILSQNNWYLNRSLEPYMKLLDEGHAVVGGNAILQFPFGDSNELFMSDDTLLRPTVAIAFNEDFCCKRQLNSIISRLWSTNLLYQFVNEQSYITHMKKRKPPVATEPVHPIQIGEIFGVFIILLIGLIISLLTVFGELIVFRRKVSFSHIKS